MNSSCTCGLDVPQELGQVELRHRDEAGTLVQGQVQQHGQPVDVEERQQGQQPVLGVIPERPDCSTLATRFRWLSITPLGRPVVPEE